MIPKREEINNRNKTMDNIVGYIPPIIPKLKYMK